VLPQPRQHLPLRDGEVQRDLHPVPLRLIVAKLGRRPGAYAACSEEHTQISSQGGPRLHAARSWSFATGGTGGCNGQHAGLEVGEKTTRAPPEYEDRPVRILSRMASAIRKFSAAGEPASRPRTPADDMIDWSWSHTLCLTSPLSLAATLIHGTA
jgi:hypothetical protein